MPVPGEVVDQKTQTGTEFVPQSSGHFADTDIDPKVASVVSPIDPAEKTLVTKAPQAGATAIGETALYQPVSIPKTAQTLTSQVISPQVNESPVRSPEDLFGFVDLFDPIGKKVDESALWNRGNKAMEIIKRK